MEKSWKDFSSSLALHSAVCVQQAATHPAMPKARFKKAFLFHLILLSSWGIYGAYSVISNILHVFSMFTVFLEFRSQEKNPFSNSLPCNILQSEDIPPPVS